jgi:hypothetical protein
LFGKEIEMTQEATAEEILTPQLAYIKGAIERAKQTLPEQECFGSPEYYDFYVTIRAADEIAMTFNYASFFGAKPVTVTECAER